MNKKNSSVNVVFSTSNEYLPLLNVALLSLVKHSDANTDYNIYILTKLDFTNVENALAFIKDYDNVNLRLVDMNKHEHLLHGVKLYTSGYVTTETYWRFCIPEIIHEGKVLYCDSDVIFTDDVAKLYNIDLEGHIIAAALNVSAIYNYTINNKLPTGKLYQPYMLEELKLKDPNYYFQAGISLLNVDKMRKTHFLSACLEKCKVIKEPVFYDQDILNAVCQGDVKLLPLQWNHVWYFWNYAFLKDVIPMSLYNEYDEARKLPKIIHYAGPKPYSERHRPLSGVFWKYALNSNFFEYFLKKAFGPATKELVIDDDLFASCEVRPAFDNQISIILSSSNTYAPYLGVSISSLLENMDIECNYDILVLETGLNHYYKRNIEFMVAKYPNCSIRFINLCAELRKFERHFYTCHQLSKETYYRLFIDRFLVGYDRVIYIDADTLILDDLKSLDQLDLNGNLIAAVKDYVVQSGAKNHVRHNGTDLSYYLDNVICLDYRKYVQCGILVFNLEEMRKVGFSTRAMRMLQYLHNPRFVDQDVINKVCEDKIYYLPAKYNYLAFYTQSLIEKVDEEFHPEIMSSSDDIKIFHMPGAKPDMFPDSDMANLYFEYANRSPFYENIIHNMVKYQLEPSRVQIRQLYRDLSSTHFPSINRHFQANERVIKLLYVSIHYNSLAIRKLRYRVRSIFSISKRVRSKYREKYKHLKSLLKESKKLKREMF